jgi:hypothetical protein
VAEAEFRLLGSAANVCTTIQKRVAASQVVTIAKWGVLIY